MEHSLNEALKHYKEQIQKGHIQRAYRGLMQFMMDLRTYFSKEYPDNYITGQVHQGYMDVTFFPFTPKSLKKLKLKVILLFHHPNMRFEVWLAGQNRQVQKQYWEIFKGSDWNKYRIPETVKEGFSVVDHVIIENPDFDHLGALTKQIESEVMQFIRNIEEVLI